MSESPIAAFAPTPSKAPILPLTSVRIFAAAYVVLLHCYLWTSGFDVTTWFGRFVRNGYTAVGFFFALSGYILAYVYLNTERTFDQRAFWVSRFARIYPLLFVSLLLDIPHNLILHFAHHNLAGSLVRTFAGLIGESLLLQAWVPSLFLGINGPSWSLSCEAFFYFMFPFLAFWVWKKKRAAALTWFLVFWCAAIFVPTISTALKPSLFTEILGSQVQLSLELTPVLRIFEFLAGVALCALQVSVVAKYSPSVRSRFGYLSLAVAAVLFFFCIQYSNHIPLLVMSDGFLLPVYGLIILGLSNIRGWLQYLLSHKLFVTLGESSYAVYLLHDPLFFYVLRGHKPSGSLPWLAYLATVLIASIASFMWLERPARRKILSWAEVRPPVTLQQERVSPS